MSNPHSHSSKPHGASTGGDDMNLKKIVLVGVAALVLFAVGIIWARILLTRQLAEIKESGMAPPASEIGKPEIGIVDQVLFSTDNRLELWNAEHAKRLGSYGWVDRAKGLAHMPIEQAMQKVIASPPDIAGEGVPPAAVPPTIPAPAPAEEEAPRKAGKSKSKADKKADKAAGEQP